MRWHVEHGSDEYNPMLVHLPVYASNDQWSLVRVDAAQCSGTLIYTTKREHGHRVSNSRQKPAHRSVMVRLVAPCIA